MQPHCQHLDDRRAAGTEKSEGAAVNSTMKVANPNRREFLARLGATVGAVTGGAACLLPIAVSTRGQAERPPFAAAAEPCNAPRSSKRLPWRMPGCPFPPTAPTATKNFI